MVHTKNKKRLKNQSRKLTVKYFELLESKSKVFQKLYCAPLGTRKQKKNIKKTASRMTELVAKAMGIP